MGALLLELACSMLAIRGHIPPDENYRPMPANGSPAGHARIIKAIATLLAVVAFLAAAVWGAVWLAIRFL